MIIIQKKNVYLILKDLGIDPDSLEFKEVPESKYLTKPQGYFDNENSVNRFYDLVNYLSNK